MGLAFIPIQFNFQISSPYTLFSSYRRPYWRCYYANTDAVIYVVDSVDRDRIGISKQELLSMLEVTEKQSKLRNA
jgi:hypothetical protein